MRRRHDLRRRDHVCAAHDPALLDFCSDIREVAKPGALFLNYSNPMAMNTWACNKYGGVQTIGLCHGVQGAHWQIARAIEHVGAAKRDAIGAGREGAPRAMSTSSPPGSIIRPGSSRRSGAAWT